MANLNVRTDDQNIQMPTYFELANAVLGVPRVLKVLKPIRMIAVLSFLPVTAISWLIVGMSALAGWLWVGAIVLALNTAFDRFSCRSLVRSTQLLDRGGLNWVVRLATRGVLLAALLIGCKVPWGLAPITTFAFLITLGVLYLAGGNWLQLRQPLLRYSQDPSKQPEGTLRFAKSYVLSNWPSVAMLSIEVLVIFGSATLDAVLVPKSWVWLAATAGILVIFILAGQYGLTLMKLGSGSATKAIHQEVLAYLNEHKPEVIIYSADSGPSGYILNQWLPTFSKLPQNKFVIVREAFQLSPIEPTSLPVVFAPRTHHVEELVIPSVLVAFYLANSGKNVHLLREARIKHVFLNHGDSDKSTSANPFSKVYDEVWVAGQAAIDRFRAAAIDIPTSHFQIVGRPQVESLQVGPRDQIPLTVLYAPTFEGFFEESNYSSLEVMGVSMIEHILKIAPDIRIYFKPHPHTGVNRVGMTRARDEVAEMLAIAGSQHAYIDSKSDISLFSCFNAADVLISDISSVVTDFLYTGRPIITTNPRQLNPEAFYKTFPTQVASYIAQRDLCNFDDLLRDAIGADSKRIERLESKKYVLGDLPDGPTAALIQATNFICEASKVHASLITSEFRIKTKPASSK